jgi:hypothetical protein
MLSDRPRRAEEEVADGKGEPCVGAERVGEWLWFGIGTRKRKRRGREHGKRASSFSCSVAELAFLLYGHCLR